MATSCVPILNTIKGSPVVSDVPDEPLREFTLTIKVRVRDYSASDAVIGMHDVLADYQHWIVGEPDIVVTND